MSLSLIKQCIPNSFSSTNASACFARIAGVSFGLALFSAASSAPLPDLPDEALQNCMHEQAQTMGWTDAEQVTQLDCDNRGVRDLWGIEQLPNLQFLSLRDNALQDLMPLDSSSAPRLIELDISNNRSLVLEQVNWVLAAQGELTSLGLAGIRVDQLEALNVPQKDRIVALDLSRSGINTLVGIESFSSLQELSVSDNGIEDIFPVGVLQGLRELDISNNAVVHLHPLQDRSELTELVLSGNSAIDRGELKELLQSLPHVARLGLGDLAGAHEAVGNLPHPERIKVLDLSGSGMEAGAGLESFSNVERLNVSHNGLDDLHFIGAMPQLRSLSAANNRLHFLPLSLEQKGLKELDVSHNLLNDLTDIEPLQQLTLLNLSGNPISDYGQLGRIIDNLNEVQHLLLSGLRLNAGALDRLMRPDRIKTLDISGTGAEDIDHLQRFTRLERLDVSDNRVEHLGGVGQMHRLKSLSAANNQLQDAWMPEPLWDLEELDLSNNGLTHILDLQMLQGLRSLNLSGNQQIDPTHLQQVLGQMRVLESLGVNEVRNGADVLEIIPQPELMRQLSIGGSGLQHTHVLERFMSLEQLNVSNNQLHELDGVHSMAQLKSLDASRNRLTDVPVFASSTSVKELDLSENQISLLNSYDLHSTLTSLDVSGNGELDLSGVMNAWQHLYMLEHLGLGGLSDVDNLLQQLPEPRRLKSLNVSNTGVEHLFSIERFSQLEYLNLNDNRFFELHFLQSMSNLKSLKVAGNRISYLPDWANHSQLQALDLSFNLLGEIGSLAQLYNLRSLYLTGNSHIEHGQLSSVLSNLYELEELGLGQLGIEHHFLGNIQRPEKLTALDISGSKMNELYDLHAFSHLESLNINGSGVTDLNFVQGMPQLRVLNAARNQLHSIETLNSVEHLRELDLSSNPALRFEQVASVVGHQRTLKRLGVSGIDIPPGDFYPVYAPHGLEELDVSRANLHDTYLLQPFENLRVLRASENNIESAATLGNLNKLTHLDLGRNALADAEFVSLLGELVLLDLSYNPGLQMALLNSAVSGLHNVRQLALAGLGIKGIWDVPLPNPLKLRTLDVSGNDLLELHGVEQFENLMVLKADDNRLFDLMPLGVLPQLKTLSVRNNRLEWLEWSSGSDDGQLVHLDLRGNPIVDLGALSQQHGLRSLGLSGSALLTFDHVAPILQNQIELQQLQLENFEIYSALDIPLSGDVLQVLSLRNVQLQDLTSIERFRRLQVLDVSDNHLQDVASLDQLAELHSLDVSNNNLEFLPGIEYLNALRSLNVSYNPTSLAHVNDVLSQLPALQSLALAGINAGYLGEVAVMDPGALISLNVSDMGLQDLVGLEAFDGLTQLDVSGNPLGDITAVQYLHGLKELDVSDNEQLGSFSGVWSLHNLSVLKLNNTGADHVEEILLNLPYLTQLQQLALASLPLPDLYQLNLARPDMLTSLNLRGALLNVPFGDIGKLGNFSNLRELDLSDNDLQDVNALNDLQEVARMNLSGNNLMDVGSLYALAQEGNLAELNLLGSHRLPCEQLDFLASVVTLRLVRPELCSTGLPPELAVMSPAHEEQLSSEQWLVLSAHAVDSEDGDLSARIQWVSDIDGFLGAGSLLDVKLSAGTHRLHILIEDSDGNVAEAYRVVEVSGNIDYCTASATSTTYEWIGAVSVNGIENQSGADAGYGDHLGTVFALDRGYNDLQLTPGYSWSSYWENWLVWVDFDQDGQFSMDEQVTSAYASGHVMSSMTVPPSAKSGETRMRVAMRFDRAPDSCGRFDWGEVEDYTVIIP